MSRRCRTATRVSTSSPRVSAPSSPPNHRTVASELARVCRPGGRVALHGMDVGRGSRRVLPDHRLLCTTPARGCRCRRYLGRGRLRRVAAGRRVRREDDGARHTLGGQVGRRDVDRDVGGLRADQDPHRRTPAGAGRGVQGRPARLLPPRGASRDCRCPGRTFSSTAFGRPERSGDIRKSGYEGPLGRAAGMSAAFEDEQQAADLEGAWYRRATSTGVRPWWLRTVGSAPAAMRARAASTLACSAAWWRGLVPSVVVARGSAPPSRSSSTARTSARPAKCRAVQPSWSGRARLLRRRGAPPPLLPGRHRRTDPAHRPPPSTASSPQPRHWGRRLRRATPASAGRCRSRRRTTASAPPSARVLMWLGLGLAFLVAHRAVAGGVDLGVLGHELAEPGGLLGLFGRGRRETPQRRQKLRSGSLPAPQAGQATRPA